MDVPEKKGKKKRCVSDAKPCTSIGTTLHSVVFENGFCITIRIRRPELFVSDQLTMKGENKERVCRLAVLLGFLHLASSLDEIVLNAVITLVSVNEDNHHDERNCQFSLSPREERDYLPDRKHSSFGTNVPQVGTVEAFREFHDGFVICNAGKAAEETSRRERERERKTYRTSLAVSSSSKISQKKDF